MESVAGDIYRRGLALSADDARVVDSLALSTEPISMRSRIRAK
jgi:hypothetical protein